MKRELKPNEIENLRGYIKVIEAFIQGKEIQSRVFGVGEWEDCKLPAFNFYSKEYRIKPEVKELYYCVYKTCIGCVYTTNPVDKEFHQGNINTIIGDNGVILEERKITVISEYE